MKDGRGASVDVEEGTGKYEYGEEKGEEEGGVDEMEGNADGKIEGAVCDRTS
jgi:hypothetical protein